MTAETLIVIARKLEDRGGKYGPNSNTSLVELLEHVAGPASAVSTFEILQAGVEGEPISCGGLTWTVGMDAALLLDSPNGDGARRIVSTSEAVGWAIKTGPNEFDADGATVDRPTLDSLGGLP